MNKHYRVKMIDGPSMGLEYIAYHPYRKPFMFFNLKRNKFFEYAIKEIVDRTMYMTFTGKTRPAHYWKRNG